MIVSETVLQELERLTGTDQVRKDPHVDLFGHKLLDSLGAVELTDRPGRALRPRAFPERHRPRNVGNSPEDHRLRPGKNRAGMKRAPHMSGGRRCSLIMLATAAALVYAVYAQHVERQVRPRGGGARSLRDQRGQCHRARRPASSQTCC